MKTHDLYIETVRKALKDKTGCNFISVSIKGDGNCLYRSAAHICKGNQDMYVDMKREVI